MQQQNRIADLIQANVTYYKGFRLPTPQTTGTLTQQRSYAMQSANNFITKHKL